MEVALDQRLRMICVPLTGPRHVVPEYGIRIPPSLVRLALPEAAIAQLPVPDPVAVPVTLQLIDVPANVPVPVPVTWSVPKHVAENVPEPVSPDT